MKRVVVRKEETIHRLRRFLWRHELVIFRKFSNRRNRWMKFCSISLSLILLILTLNVVTTMSASTVPDRTCREHPNLVGKCFTVHGRLAVYNGAPALRIWKIGTKRILGVSEQRFAIPGYQNVPEDIRNQIDQDNVILADFLVCPFTKLKQKEMQMVCIEKANNIVVKARSN